jgi:hypothetical protein
MSVRSTKKSGLVIGLIAFGCVLVDAGVLLALGGAITWLSAMTSPYLLGGIVVVGALAARGFQFLKQAGMRTV